MSETISILLVEDEFVSAMLMQKQLKFIGYALSHHVTTGEDAIDFARQNPPDIILMDIRLAGEIDGIEAAAEIKSVSDIPIIFLTGYDDQTVRERAEKTNPLDFLVKPLEINKLKAILDNYTTSAAEFQHRSPEKIGEQVNKIVKE